MPGKLRPALLILPGIHLALCGVTQASSASSEGSWAWFPMFLLDFPASIAFLPFSGAPPFLVFALLGGLWWYFLGRLLAAAIARNKRG